MDATTALPETLLGEFDQVRAELASYTKRIVEIDVILARSSVPHAVTAGEVRRKDDLKRERADLCAKRSNLCQKYAALKSRLEAA
jgi:hypothetical protein